MGLQEGLMLLGAVVFLLVLLDAVRRKRAAARRQNDDYEDPEEVERRAQLARELPSLGLDDSKSSSQQGLDPLFDDIDVFDDDPIPVLRNKQYLPDAATQADIKSKLQPTSFTHESNTNISDSNVSDEELAWDKMRRMFALDPAFAKASRTSMEQQQKELQLLQEKKNLLVQEQEEQAFFAQQEPEELVLVEEAVVEELIEAEQIEETEAFDDNNNDDNVDDLVEFEYPTTELPEGAVDQPSSVVDISEQTSEATEIDPEERERILRTALLTSLEKSAWGSSEVFLTINVNAPEDQPFVGSHLCSFMDMIGMKLSESGFYHYVEEKDGLSYLGYSLVNMFSPGNFNPNAEEDFSTAGVVLVMPLPNTPRPMAVFERMLATAKVMEKNWGADLQDEQRSNLTQQTIEHYRQTIKDFEYQTRVNAKKAELT